METNPPPSTPQVVSYATPGVTEAPPSIRGKGFLSASAGFYLPGLGHLIARRPRRALLWFAISVLLTALSIVCVMFRATMPALVVIVPLIFGVAIVSIIDAYRIGRQNQRPILRHPLMRYLAGAALLAASVFITPSEFIAPLIRRHLFETFRMPSISMAPTLIDGDKIIVNKRAGYGRWSMVAHDALENRPVKYVKRIVGLPGETVDIVNGELLINGQPVPRPEGVPPYIDPPGVGPGHRQYPKRLAKDEYFVIGDNSRSSADSRIWFEAAEGHQSGVIPKDYILGPVTAIYWPPKRWRRFE